jgi:hypothetical protein
MRGAILPPSIYVFTARCLVKHKDNFATKEQMAPLVEDATRYKDTMPHGGGGRGGSNGYTHFPTALFAIFHTLLTSVLMLQIQIHCCKDNHTTDITLVEKGLVSAYVYLVITSKKYFK